jgi:hypothetical protein
VQRLLERDGVEPRVVGRRDAAAADAPPEHAYGQTLDVLAEILRSR